jgi:hypothetical protein
MGHLETPSPRCTVQPQPQCMISNEVEESHHGSPGKASESGQGSPGFQLQIPMFADPSKQYGRTLEYAG